MDAKKKSKAGALIRSSAAQKKSSSRLRRGKATMMNTVDEECDDDAELLGSSSVDAACKTACLAKKEHCYGLQSGDLWSSSPPPSLSDECSDACKNAMDTYETACQNCFGLALPGSAQSHREACDGVTTTGTGTTTPPTVGFFCALEASSGDGTSCEDACKAYYQTCHEADENAPHDDVMNLCNENYCL
eukprot:g8787.t1